MPRTRRTRTPRPVLLSAILRHAERTFASRWRRLPRIHEAGRTEVRAVQIDSSHFSVQLRDKGGSYPPRTLLFGVSKRGFNLMSEPPTVYMELEDAHRIESASLLSELITSLGWEITMAAPVQPWTDEDERHFTKFAEVCRWFLAWHKLRPKVVARFQRQLAGRRVIAVAGSISAPEAVVHGQNGREIHIHLQLPAALKRAYMRVRRHWLRLMDEVNAMAYARYKKHRRTINAPWARTRRPNA